MQHAAQTQSMDQDIAVCPYCGATTGVDLPDDHAPVFVFCDVCATRFIAERLAEGFEVMTVEDAPCCSNPGGREIEMGGCDEA